jgi:diguanylate cyclase (GGDEF)-like protein
VDSLPSHLRASLDKEISWIESNPFRWLSFSPTLEDEFENMAAARRSQRIVIQGILCVLVYNFFALSDYFLSRRNFIQSLEVRLGLATPLAVASITGLHFCQRINWIRESLILFVCCVFSACVLYLYFDISAVVSAYALIDVILVLLFTNVGIQIRFSYAIAASALCVSMGGIYVYLDRWLSKPQKMESLAVLLADAFLSLVANYNIESGERMSFLLRMRSAMQTEDLTIANEHLQQIANEDKLTGISNRRHFDEVYKLIWEQCVSGASAISVVMIDIDHFKRLNDRYGHAHGDAVLSRIAKLLREDVRVRGDFVARYGGEEFVVVIANSSTEIAERVAERLRFLVETAGHPANCQGRRFEEQFPTISCGVATVHPHPDMELWGPITLADKALYQAKAEGRNRVCYAAEVKTDRKDSGLLLGWKK